MDATPSSRRTASAALACLLAGCNLVSLDASGEAKPATEETVVGTWRNAEPDAEGRTVRMTLRIDADHNLVWSRRWSAPVPDGNDREYQRENMAWEVAGGALKAVKTACEYLGEEGGLAPADCRGPLEMAIPIQVNGNAWSIAEGGRVMLFRKDR